jgi:putative DNA primase/helicase
MEAEFPESPVIFERNGTPILRSNHIGEIWATRGTGKTWLAASLALVAASDATIFGIRAPKPRRVLYIDGEMTANEIKNRFALLKERMGVKGGVQLTIVARDWQDGFFHRLDTPQGQQAIELFVEDADLIFPDNRSCLLDPAGEMDIEAWQPTQDYLLRLRRRRKTTILVHHAKRQGTARGLSKAEDLLDFILKLSLPSDYKQEQGCRFVAEFEKHGAFYGPAAAKFVATLTADGWVSDDNPVDTEIAARLLAALDTTDKPPTTITALAGMVTGRKAEVLRVAKQLLADRVILQNPFTGVIHAAA